ncbi:hypothetical protein jaqu_30030 [Jannaschia aquimarina]|uniref:VPLPA-CTERM protein sorting domain protein n=2 Tax=Jannaschia aquimarina TaxID=935700 RepID=A0A0D1EC26_9RHOB|nr:VPLPA-CTERM sorting domain-containing protein [Jannaschia aquimarina]KIT15274.1 hypothetical protein jaqu_30030 [Jannaschia aquimarina]SNT42488.1 VPLPA-CTERM protein sorting domain-containing protein [Jannaschia aquimarina]
MGALGTIAAEAATIGDREVTEGDTLFFAANTSFTSFTGADLISENATGPVLTLDPDFGIEELEFAGDVFSLIARDDPLDDAGEEMLRFLFAAAGDEADGSFRLLTLQGEFGDSVGFADSSTGSFLVQAATLEVIPLPAGVWLLMGALGALGALRRARGDT